MREAHEAQRRDPGQELVGRPADGTGPTGSGPARASAPATGPATTGRGRAPPARGARPQAWPTARPCIQRSPRARPGTGVPRIAPRSALMAAGRRCSSRYRPWSAHELVGCRDPAEIAQVPPRRARDQRGQQHTARAAGRRPTGRHGTAANPPGRPQRAPYQPATARQPSATTPPPAATPPAPAASAGLAATILVSPSACPMRYGDSPKATPPTRPEPYRRPSACPARADRVSCAQIAAVRARGSPHPRIGAARIIPDRSGGMSTPPDGKAQSGADSDQWSSSAMWSKRSWSAAPANGQPARPPARSAAPARQTHPRATCLTAGRPRQGLSRGLGVAAGVASAGIWEGSEDAIAPRSGPERPARGPRHGCSTLGRKLGSPPPAMSGLAWLCYLL